MVSYTYSNVLDFVFYVLVFESSSLGGKKTLKKNRQQKVTPEGGWMVNNLIIRSTLNF